MGEKSVWDERQILGVIGLWSTKYGCFSFRGVAFGMKVIGVYIMLFT